VSAPVHTIALVSPTTHAGRVLDGRYRLERVLGVGGMGTVYLATQLAVDRSVAVKLIGGARAGDPEARARFEREARTVSRLKSPHSVMLHDFGLDGGDRYMVMEYVEGRTLAARLAEGRPALAETLAIVTAIAEALVEAHGLGIVHRDLKPANVMLYPTPDGERVKVLDFGIAALERTDGDEARSGTPGYIAPEAVLGGAVDARADVYAVGAILYLLLTGRPAFSGGDREAVLGAQLHDDPPPLATLRPDAPIGLRRLCQRCLAREPRLRPRDGAELRAELELVAEASDAAQAPTEGDLGGVARGAAHAQRSRGVIAALVVAAAGVIAVAAWLARRAWVEAPVDTPAETQARPTGALSAAEAAELVPLARRFVGHIERRDYAALDGYLDEATAVAWPLDQRRRVWESLQASLGGYRGVVGERHVRLDGLRVVFLELAFGTATADLKLVFDDRPRVVGVWFTNVLPLDPSALVPASASAR
jgi:serine/threonine-protein kinase